MNKPIISVENLSKAYRIGLREEIPDTITGALTGWLKAPLRNFKRLRRLNTFQNGPVARDHASASEIGGNGQHASCGQERSAASRQPSDSDSQLATLDAHPSNDVIWALNDVSFDVNEGEVVGIIGRNGAGKSTLLKILARITEPTSGRAVIRGRIASLLEVGTGFHPELTGRENIYMNGTILGMRKREIDDRFDEIVDFSGVEKFLDTPIKRYSSGMQVRLAFAVAANLDPEILIIDEVLAVGDAEFQKKCLGKMQDVAASGRTVLFVSHNTGAIQALCTRCALIRNGRLMSLGSTAAIISEYQRQQTYPSKGKNKTTATKQADGAFFQSLRIASNEIPNSMHMGDSLDISFEYKHSAPPSDLQVAISFEDVLGQRLLAVSTSVQCPRLLKSAAAIGRVECTLHLPFTPGTYFVTLLAADSGDHLASWQSAGTFDVTGRDVFGTGQIPTSRHGFIYVPAQWKHDDADLSNEHSHEL